MELKTNKSLTLADLEAVIAYINRNIKAGTFPRIATIETYHRDKAKKWLKNAKKGSQLYSIAYAGKEVVGVAHIDVSHGRMSHCGKLAITVDYKHRRKGIATELLRSIIELSTFYGLRNLRGEPTRDNIATIKLLEKFRFKREGIREKAFKSDEGELIDLLEYTLVIDIQ